MQRFILIILIAASSLISRAQTFEHITIQPSTATFHSFDINESSEIIIYSEENKASIFNGVDFSQINSDKQRTYPTDSLGIGAISDQAIFLKSTIYATTDRGIWIDKSGGLKQLSFNDIRLPENILKIHVTQGDQLFILTTDAQLYLWDNSDYKLSKIDISRLPYVKDLTMDEWGQLWLLSDNQLHHTTIFKNIYVPRIKITDIQSSFESLDHPWRDLRFESDQMILSIISSAVDLRGKPISYQYRVNADKWSVSSTSSVINLTDLAAGRYEFQIRASTDQINHGYSESIPFTVTESIWKGYLPYLAIGLLTLALLWIFSYLNYNRQISKLSQTSQQLRLKNKLLHEEQRTQQLQMNPHFIFNTLNTIQGVIASGDASQARKMINSYAQMMRSLLNQSREDAVTLKDELKFIKHYLSLEKTARNNKFDYEVIIDGALDQEIKIPPMIIQPILENAIVHGMKGISHQGKIEVKLSQLKSNISVSIDDNGKGRYIQKDNKRKSHGLAILKERLASYSRIYEENHIKITDKIGDKQQSNGTLVTIKLPIIS